MSQGILLLDKPPGASSFQALSAVKRALGTRRIGHAGTLDPFAAGLLLVLVGRLTRLCPFASTMDKEYVAQVRFGRSTDTLDPDGREVQTGPVPERADVEAILRQFTGDILQVPPQFSAVQVGGVRAYRAARRGERVALAPRPVRIHTLTLIDWSPPEALLRLSCSRGTYVRALARDMGDRLGTCAMLSGLTRTRIGGFLLEEAIAPQAAGPSALLPASAFFDRCPGISRLTVREEWVRAVMSGVPVQVRFLAAAPAADGTYGLFSPGGTLLAMVERKSGELRYAAVLAGGDP